jgi:hypothetical protein
MPNRAFVRYKKCGNIVPGSLILTNGSYPEPDAGWIEVPIKMPCGSIRISETAQAGDPDEICWGGFALVYDNGYTLISGAGYASTIAGVIENLNAAYGFLGKWSASGLIITLDMKLDVADGLVKGQDLNPGGAWSMIIYCGG